MSFMHLKISNVNLKKIPKIKYSSVADLHMDFYSSFTIVKLTDVMAFLFLSSIESEHLF